MLGPIGKTVRSVLTKAGYKIYRPTHFENSIMHSPWEDWFSSDPHAFAAIYAQNRTVLAGIEQWVDAATLDRSLWRYGVPEKWDTKRQGLNMTGLNEIEKEVTYTDLIAFIGHTMRTPIRYLEIGVSVGKNFLQISKQFPDGLIVGLDVEAINPPLAREFQSVEHVWQSNREYEVETLSGSSAEVRLSHCRVNREGEPGLYVRGDQFSPDTWASLKGHQFNLIFSDGVHSARAVRDELDHLLTNDLLPSEGEFVMYWDDLVNIAMQTAFVDNAKRLKERFGGNSWFALHWIHGTYGAKRLNGIFSTINT